MSHYDILLAKKLSGGGGLTPYAVTREFTLTAKSTTPYNFVDITEEEVNLFLNAGRSETVAVITYNDTVERFISSSYAVVNTSSTNSIVYVKDRNISGGLTPPNRASFRINAKTSPYGLALHSCAINSETASEIKIKFEFYSLESIL